MFQHHPLCIRAAPRTQDTAILRTPLFFSGSRVPGEACLNGAKAVPFPGPLRSPGSPGRQGDATEPVMMPPAPEAVPGRRWWRFRL